MATRRSNTNIWVVLSVVATVFFGVSSFVWSIIQSQISELRTDFSKKTDSDRWTYATKDFVTGKLEGLKAEEDTYRKGLDHVWGKKP